MLKDLFYDVFGLNESDDGHRPMALGTHQGIDFRQASFRAGRHDQILGILELPIEVNDNIDRLLSILPVQDIAIMDRLARTTANRFSVFAFDPIHRITLSLTRTTP